MKNGYYYAPSMPNQDWEIELVSRLEDCHCPALGCSNPPSVVCHLKSCRHEIVPFIRSTINAEVRRALNTVEIGDVEAIPELEGADADDCNFRNSLNAEWRTAKAAVLKEYPIAI